MRPSFMVRLGDWKYHYCHETEPQLFNLANDPNEWTNLAGDPQHAALERKLLDILTNGQFDLNKIATEVWDRLPLKQVVNAAMKANDTHWDYQVDQNASGLYVRS